MADPFKLVILPATKSGLGRAGIAQHLANVHGPLVMAHPEASGRFSSYVHHYVLSGDALPSAAGADAVTIIGFADVADMAASKASAPYRELICPDEDNFRDEAESRAFRGVEHVLRDGDRRAAKKLLIFQKQIDRDQTERLVCLGPQAIHIVCNLLSPLGPPKETDFDVMVEVGLAESTDAAMMSATLKTQLRDDSVILLTQAKVFV